MDHHKTAIATVGTEAYKTHLKTGTHDLLADEPVDKGGQDAGPTSEEYLCMSLAACTSITLRMFADRKQWDTGEIRVSVSFERVENITKFKRLLVFEKDISAEMRERLMVVANKCPIHKILSNPIEISSEMA